MSRLFISLWNHFAVLFLLLPCGRLVSLFWMATGDWIVTSVCFFGAAVIFMMTYGRSGDVFMAVHVPAVYNR